MRRCRRWRATGSPSPPTTAWRTRSIPPTPRWTATLFALATGAIEVEPDPDIPVAMSPETKLVALLGAAGAHCLARAVLVGVLAAESVAGIPTYRDMLPGAFA